MVLLFAKNIFLAVVGDDDDGVYSFWLCRTVRKVDVRGKFAFDINWLEKKDDDKEDVYTLANEENSIDIRSVVTQVFPKKKGNGEYVMSAAQVRRVTRCLSRMEAGEAPGFRKEVNGFDIVESEDKDMEEEEKEKEAEDNEEKNKKKKVTPKKKPNAAAAKVVSTKAIKKTSAPEKETVKEKKARIKAAAPKASGVKVKKAPNYRLKENANVTFVAEDPYFHSKATAGTVPYVSSVVHSKLLFNAVHNKDKGMLKRLCDDTGKVHSLMVSKSMADDNTALHYAIKTQNSAAVHLLLQQLKDKPYATRQQKAVDKPSCMMQTIGTGKYNYRSLGIKKIRRINVSRGGREGNNALVKDTNCEGDNGELSEKMMEWDTPASIVTSVINAEIQVQANQVLNDTVHAVRHGNNDLAEAVMSKYAAKFNMCWGTLNHHHIEALAKGGEKKWAKNPVRLVSVQKKGPKGMTPLHCACSNPDVGPLKHLFGVCPDVNLGDDEQRKLAHYAAACKGLGPLKFLLDNGANLEDTNKMGMTPLIVAAEVGRAENVEFIIKCIKEKQEAAGGMDAAMIKKFGVAGVNRPMRNSWCAVHHACCNGHLDVVKVLIKYEADFEKSLNTLFDGKSALMLAAARGHVDIVEYLFDFVKTAKFDRYKRTALTHAIMNGSSNVASFLLHKGVDPNRPDTSGNTPLMYACAYGWYHCTKLLVDAGAQINAANEWKLTPVSVAMLKGHTGISKYLLDMPGVDINFRDDKGRTVLVTMLANLSTEKPLTQELVREIKDMVERRGADPKIADNDNMNALHFLCQYNGYPDKSCDEQINEKVKEKFRKKWNNQKKLLDEMTAFLLDKGVSTLDIDKNGYMPVARAFEAPIDDMKRKNYDIIQRILKKMVSEALTRPSQSLNVDKKKANIWHTFTANISLVGINEESFIYTSLNTIFNNLAKCDSIVPSLASVMNAPVASSNFTPLHQLCATYAAINDFKETEYHGDLKDVQYSDLTWDESTGHLSNMSSLVDLFRDLIFALANRCKLDYDIINTFEGETKTTTFSVLTPLSLVEWKEEQHTAFKTMLKHTRNVDYTDGEGRTQLVLATRSNNTKVIKAWIDAGADINLIFESELSQKVNVPEGDVGASDEFDPDETVTLKSCPLIEAVLKANLEIVRHLISAGVDTKSVGPVSTDSHQRSYYNYVIFVAVSSCIAQRKNKERTNILKALLNAGVSINTTDNFTGKSALHFAVNSSTDGADQNLDLEIALLRNNSDVFAKDFRERLALHHCFVKVGKHLDNTRTDPIEVCSMLVEAMNGKQIDNVDAYGCSPLHYAAYRGATVCCLLLLEKGADIEAVDHKGNTPLAYSVFGGHEGCALVLLQKGANLNVKIHPNLTDTPDVVDKFSVHQFSFIPKHFDQEKDKSKEPYSLFQGLVQNNWLGITYMALQKLESFGMSYAKAVEVAFVMQKVQFAKTLIGKQASVTKLKETVSNGRNLVCSLAFECKATSDPDVQVDILELLTSAGVSIHQSEDEGSSPLHFACLRHNIELIKALLLAKAEPSFPNQYNLTPLGSIFWNFERDSSNMRKCVNLLMNDGADINIMMPFKEFSYLLDGCVPRARSETNYFKTKSGDLNLTPLIIAVIHRDEEMVKLLMTHASSKVDVNLADKKGMTPIMHAVKTNDIRIVLRLLDKGGELPLEPKTDKMQSIQKIINMDLSKLVTSGVNVDAQDNCGYNAIHHLIELSTSTEGGLKATYDNEEVLQLLLRLGISATTPVTENCGQKTALEMAEEVGAVKIAAKLRSTFKLQGRLPFVPPEVDDAIDWEGTQVYDIVDDAHRMLRKLEHEADKAGKAELAKKKRKAKSGAGLFMSLGYPVMKLARKSSNSYEDEDDDDNDDAEDEEDEKEEEREEEEREEEDQEEEESEEDGNEYVNGVKDARREKPTGCIVGLGGTIYDDRALVMTKIDVRQGAFGMYNYYRMQIWKEKYKDLWILFTNWGRIGHFGQYQNTPYGTAQQAMDEFEKIFKDKAGNEWQDKDSFVKKANKYRLVKSDHLKQFKKKTLKFNLESIIPSRLPEDVQHLLRDVTDISAHIDAYKKIGVDHDAVPFGRIDRKVVEQAKGILEKLRPLVAKKETICQKRANSKAPDDLNAKLFEAVQEINDLSSEYYHLMPKMGYDFSKLLPIDQEYLLNQECSRVSNTLDFETSERLILGAQYRRSEINPLDYIYKAMGCHIRPMEPTEPMVPMILQYLYNSSDSQEYRVEAIYQVRRPIEDVTFGTGIKSKDLNRKLNWHGTKAAHLLGIINSGLMIKAAGAAFAGSAFGDGIYTANVFKKSSCYTHDHRTSNDSNYLLLCDVAMGKTLEFTNYDRQRGVQSYPPPGFDSYSHVLSQTGPDPIHTVKMDNGGLEVPLGMLIDTKPDNCWSCNEYPEFVVYKESQVALRYIVRMCDPAKLARNERKRKADTAFGAGRKTMSIPLWGAVRPTPKKIRAGGLFG